MSMLLDKDFWDGRYKDGMIGWDIGYCSPPIKEYINQLSNKDIKILIPGAGSGYEAIYAFRNGFKNVYVCDISPIAVTNFKIKCPDFPEDQLILDDFFNIETTFDLIIEQTFFCALDPKLRVKYVNKMYDIIHKEGKLVGLLFASEFEKNGPPFGANSSVYHSLFENHFTIKTMELCYNSIAARSSNELFFISKKH